MKREVAYHVLGFFQPMSQDVIVPLQSLSVFSFLVEIFLVDFQLGMKGN